MKQEELQRRSIEAAQKTYTREWDSQTRKAIAAWDDFTEPLRKKYGIPVWKPKRGERVNDWQRKVD